MRRRPVAVYRVIDEEELLGGAYELSSHDELAAGDIDQQVLRSETRGAWRGWGPTILGVLALAGLAGLLLNLAPHLHGRVAAAPPRSGLAPRARRLATAMMPARAPLATRRGPPAVAKRAPQASERWATHRRPPRPLRAPSPVGAAAANVTRPPGGVSEAGRSPSAPAREFGFER